MVLQPTRHVGTNDFRNRLLGWVVAKTRTAEERQRSPSAKRPLRPACGRERAGNRKRKPPWSEQRERQADGRIEAAEAQASAAEFRRERSVKTNIGLHRQVQKLKEKLNQQQE